MTTRREILQKIGNFLLLCLPAAAVRFSGGVQAAAFHTGRATGEAMKLSKPEIDGSVAVEGALYARRTVRSFSSRSLPPGLLSQLLWAGQGITGKKGYKRAAPSAGALYPMDLYTVAGEQGVSGLGAGVYHYRPDSHEILRITAGDLRESMAGAALHQMWMARAPISIVITAEYSRITGKYGERGIRYALIEAGHIGQNLFLQAEALELGAGIVGAFRDNALIRRLRLPPTHEPLLIMPVGYKNTP